MDVNLGLLIFFISVSHIDAGYFSNSPTTSIHENHDAVKNIWSITAYCTVRYTDYYTCSYQSSYSCGFRGWSRCQRTRYTTCSRHEYTDEQCNVCYIDSDSSGHFQMSGLTVQKKDCGNKYCGPTCTGNGCLNGGGSHTVGVTCYRTGYETTGEISTDFTVSVTYAAAPSFYYASGSSIDVHKTQNVGSTINSMVASLQDDPLDYDTATYVQNSGPDLSYYFSTADLFRLDTSSANVLIWKDLTMEFSYFFTMNLCVYDRRNRYACEDLDITLYACFETPTCVDMEKLDLHDTFGTYTGHGGGTDVFLEMDAPGPHPHFTFFSTSWHTLTWNFTMNEFPEAELGYYSGQIYITRNISIWPAWPTKDYYQTVEVANSESCYTTTCDMHIRVHYTNWPIEIVSLPTSNSKHEDTDAESFLHSLIVYDYNYESEDNMTCYIINVSPNEINLFELKHNGGYAWNSYTLYKMRCQDPDCGYKPENYECDQDIGCMNHALRSQYTVTIQCDDAYNTTDIQDFTFNVIDNSHPAYTNLAGHIDLDRAVVSQWDIVFSILYWDLEGERLYYEYVYEDVDDGSDPGYFLGSTSGNYYNDLGNITMTVHLADKDVNKTYRIEICGHERRNEICADLTIDIEEYCGESPACTDASISVTTEFAIGDELFDISSLVTGPTLGTPYKGLSYSILSFGTDSRFFSVDTSNGKVTTLDTLSTGFPNNLHETYTIIGIVYDDGACGYGTCSLVIDVTAINYPLQIDNLPASVTVHEDLLVTETHFTVSISDANDNDTYECSIVNNMSVEPFYLERIPPVTGLFQVRNRADYALSTARLTYTVSIMCEDAHGANDTEELTIDITENEAPTFTNLGSPTTQNLDPMDYRKGDIAYVVTASDTENDVLTFLCIVATNYIPFECYHESGLNHVNVLFRRDLDIYDDNGEVVDIDICVSDAKHINASCGTLEVTFTRVRTPPEINNLPDTAYLAEDASIGDTIFTAAITDPDVGEIHVFTMTVSPSAHTNKFQLDTYNGILTVGSALDFEDINYYEFTFIVRDDFLYALTEKILAVNVTNVNEGNTITADSTSVTFYENMSVNALFDDLGIACSDIDGDAVSIDITPGVDSDHFAFSNVNNRISLVEAWDHEVDLPTASLTLTCSDGLLTSSLVIDMSILDVNDNNPSVTVTFGDVNVPIQINPSTPLTTTLATVTATDPDTSDDDDFDFRMAGDGIGFQYFRMVPRTSRKRSSGIAGADLKLRITANFVNNKTFPVTVLVCDSFDVSDTLCTGVTFTIVYTPNDPDVKQKPTKCLTCNSTGRMIIAVLIGEGCIFILLIIHFIYSLFCRRNEVIAIGNKDKSHNQRFRSRNISKPRVPLSRRNLKKKSFKSKPVRPNNPKQMPRIKDLSSSDSSSSSSSDEDDKITEMRRDNGRVRFQHGSQRSPAVVNLPPPIHAISTPGLPDPVYSCNANKLYRA